MAYTNACYELESKARPLAQRPMQLLLRQHVVKKIIIKALLKKSGKRVFNLITLLNILIYCLSLKILKIDMWHTDEIWSLFLAYKFYGRRQKNK